MINRIAFLRAVLNGRAAARDIFADWLEERGEPDEAWRWRASPWPRTDALHDLTGGRVAGSARACVLVSGSDSASAWDSGLPGGVAFEGLWEAIRDALGDDATVSIAHVATPVGGNQTARLGRSPVVTLATTTRRRKIRVAGVWLKERGPERDDLEGYAEDAAIV